MPYQNQFGSKTSHSDLVRNPDVQDFLSRCIPIREPTKAEIQRLTDLFAEPSYSSNAPEIRFVIASDGSLYHSAIDDRFPSIQVSYLKFSTILIEMTAFDGLEDSRTKLIDPFRVGALQQNKDTLSLVLPLANFRLPADRNVRETFRRQTEQFLGSTSTRFRANDWSTSLLATLAELALMRDDGGTAEPTIRIHKCPNDECEQVDLHIDPKRDSWNCTMCGTELFISDCLRIWEGVNDLHANQEPASRFMSYLEHLLPIHYLRHLRNNSPNELANVAVMIDGPLAVFGNAAWLHGCIMRFYHSFRISRSMDVQHGPLIVGLQKSGYVVDFMNRVAQVIPPNRVFCISDEFRHEHLGVSRSGNGFGSETYYGQDFVLKTESGKLFVFGLPYPFESKSRTTGFFRLKSDMASYPELSQAISLIDNVATDLYRDAVIPIALAHRHTAISLKPGGRVLDIMGRDSRPH
jgi:hypothetical protein